MTLKCISVDIGSTYTKGALFELRGGELRLLGREGVPTTPGDLSHGFGVCLRLLKEKAASVSTPDNKEKIVFSSSAAGGLSVAAVGLVPAVTMTMAKITALSAGARVSRVYSYKLTPGDIEEMETEAPDIILFAGGTDGGNEEYIRHNARLLASSALDASIIFCGNRIMRGEVEETLAGREVSFSANILPEIDRPEPEEARGLIRDIFLKKIVYGKGLDRIIASTGCDPLPTPLSILEYAKLISESGGLWQNFCLIDMGGATTDFYSVGGENPGGADVVFRGIPEPRFKRSVEGDLGMRINAGNLLEAAGDFLDKAALEAGVERDALSAYASAAEAHPELLPRNDEEEVCEKLLASACVTRAAERHAGRRERVFTSSGTVQLQTGKDLTGLGRVIGTGGFLSRIPGRFLDSAGVDERCREILLPTQAEYYRDKGYLIPLLANTARLYPEAAVTFGIKNFVKEENGIYGGNHGNPE